MAWWRWFMVTLAVLIGACGAVIGYELVAYPRRTVVTVVLFGAGSLFGWALRRG